MNTDTPWVTSLHAIAAIATVAMAVALGYTLYTRNDKALAQQHAGRANPWRGIPGCVVMDTATGPPVVPFEGKTITHCPDAEGSPMQAVAPAAIPPGIDGLRVALEPVRRPPGAAAALRVNVRAASGTTLTHAGRTIAQGHEIRLTIRPDTQVAAQTLADCLTGNTRACTTAKLDASSWKDHYEGAAVRMLGLLVMDAFTGRIEALGSAYSHCYAALHSGTALPPSCPPFPVGAAYRAHRLSNRALYAEAMPGSLIKPILALALLRAPASRRPGDEQLRDWLRRSDSVAFLDALFCKNQGFSDCGNTARAIAAARDLAWNIDCERGAGACARLGLFAASVPASGTRLHAARIFYQPVDNHLQPVTSGYAATLARECAERAWHRCDGAQFASLSAEAWGQGNALASPAGIAAMFSKLAVAARGDGNGAALPHVALVAHNAAAGSDTPAPAIDPKHARVILEGLARTHRTDGTAHSACIAVFGSAQACNTIDWLQGKTGTPVFAQERFTAQARVAHCRQLAGQLAAHQGSGEARRKLVALHSHCAMAPYKWYAALVTHGAQTKVVVALIERNYNTRTGMMDSLQDRSANLAAVAALAWAKQWRESLVTTVAAR